MRVLSLLLILAFSSVGCHENRQSVEQLRLKTEAAHDEAMKDLVSMHRAGRSLRQFVAHLDSFPPAAPATFNRQQAMKALAAIDSADAEMMSWMKNYQPPGQVPVNEALQYLEDQKQQIEKNHLNIRTATETAKQFLQKK